MIYLVAVVEPFAPVLVAWFFLRVLRAERREHGRREETLVNQVCNLAGKPWQQAPADLRAVPDVPEPLVYIAGPEHATFT